MAQTPDIDSPQYGYYVTSTFEEVSAYVQAVLSRFNSSCIFVLHASALFEKNGDQQEIHLPVHTPVVLDPTNPFINEILDNQRGLCFDTDRYEDVNESGWNLLPGTHRFWFKIYACQPNANPRQTNQNSSQQDDLDDPDDDRDRSPVRKLYQNSFLLSIGEYFLRKSGAVPSRVLLLKHREIETFIETNMSAMCTTDELHESMKLQDVPEWHSEKKMFNVRIFSMFGNVLYAKQYNETDSEWIDLYINSAKRFSLVLKLNALFSRGLDRTLCSECHTFHRTEAACKMKVVQSTNEDVVMRKVPKGRHSLVAYADFESIIKPDNSHVTSGWACCLIDKFHHMRKLQWQNAVSHNPEKLIENFLVFLFEEAYNYSLEYEGHETDNCMICDRYIPGGEDMVVGKSFASGRAGSNHLKCWKQINNCMFVFMHNFRGYDSHFLVSDIVQQCEVLGIQATSMEKFNMIRFTCERYPLVTICFKDTFNYFSCSLAKCVSMIENWVYTPENGRTQKGVFPYDWFDNFDKLNDTQLPPAPWINKLNNSLMDHETAFKEWRENGFTTFSQYHDYYMTNDTMQLADAFEEFRRTAVDEFNIDPVHFQGAPAYTWYLGYRNNPKMFKIITDKKIYLDIQSQIRGGVSQAMTRYCNVEDRPNESMFFLDVNSLYSKCMTYKMPGRLIEKLDVLPENWRDKYCKGEKHCALINVDLFYPEHLHDRDWSYPLAPHKFNDRLCTTFLRKENYLVHSELLDFYLERGLVLEKVNYLYVFEQDYTLRDYVQNNIEKRRHTNSEVMKTLYKLLNNSLYGKTCENVFKYRKFEVHEEEVLQGGQINSFLYKAKDFILYDDKYLCEMAVDEVKLNKPIQIGFTILEFAKREMYKFIAACQDHFGIKVQPLYTDTDSLLLWCDFPEPWKEFYNSPLKPYLDFEKVPESWGIKTFDTDKQSGLWSPENNGKEIIEYVGLRSKTYCYRFRDSEIVIKNKGVPKSAMISNEDDTPRQKITIDHYRRALFFGVEYKISQYAIRSEKHQVQTKMLYKLGLSANDLKRSLTSNRAISLPFGYKGETWKSIVSDADDPDHFES